MHDEKVILGNLVKALDDTRLFCVDASVHATRPWLKRVLEELAQTHQLIADELCTHITTAGGGSIPRDGRRRRTWRASWLGWVARSHSDRDLVYLQQAEKHEDRLTKRFARAVRRTPDGAHWRLERYFYEIDHARMKTARILALVEDEIDARPFEGHTPAPDFATAAPSRPAARERSHFEA
ncbi:MAG: hypothetical protein ACREP2_13830 [Rhodanobacteraceae bacterium]